MRFDEKQKAAWGSVPLNPGVACNAVSKIDFRSFVYLDILVYGTSSKNFSSLIRLESGTVVSHYSLGLGVAVRIYNANLLGSKPTQGVWDFYLV